MPAIDRRARARGRLARARSGGGGPAPCRGQGARRLARRRARLRGASSSGPTRRSRSAPGAFPRRRHSTRRAERLRRLRGRTHELHSGFALVRDGTILASGVASAHLTMRDVSDACLDDYLARAGEDGPRQRRLLPARRAGRDAVSVRSRATTSPSSACRSSPCSRACGTPRSSRADDDHSRLHHRPSGRAFALAPDPWLLAAAARH